jgi:hypothetical protein
MENVNKWINALATLDTREQIALPFCVLELLLQAQVFAVAMAIARSSIHAPATMAGQVRNAKLLHAMVFQLIAHLSAMVVERVLLLMLVYARMDIVALVASLLIVTEYLLLNPTFVPVMVLALILTYVLVLQTILEACVIFPSALV